MSPLLVFNNIGSQHGKKTSKADNLGKLYSILVECTILVVHRPARQCMQQCMIDTGTGDELITEWGRSTEKFSVYQTLQLVHVNTIPHGVLRSMEYIYDLSFF
jgi:hypothetical protein